MRNTCRLMINPYRIAVSRWHAESQNQYESMLCQGNGYLGVRAATELPSSMRTRGMFIAGSFDALSGEVSELPVAADVFGLELLIDGQYMTMEDACGYECQLELENGVLTRRCRLKTRTGVTVAITLTRVVSLANKHLLGQRIALSADAECEITLTHRLDGSVTNDGAQHMRLTQRRCQPGDCWQLGLQTNQSQVGMAFCAVGETDGMSPNAEIAMSRRSIGTRYGWQANAHNTATLTWYIGVHTTRDEPVMPPAQAAYQTAQYARKAGFETMMRESADAWEAFWKAHYIGLDGPAFDQAAIRFSLYHLRVMTPVDDGRMNIGAKGLSGEAYRGHTFWDTEMYMLMPWALTEPETARNLMRYRYLCLPKARQKARERGFEGALYPWESAWIEDGEQTPDEGEPDVVTGLPIPIRTGEMEIHVNADVAMGVWRYYEATGDDAFMTEMGWEMLWETGLYWASRAQWHDERGHWEIRGVIGPDEYTEFSDNNAYTNYLAHWNMQKALEAQAHLPDMQKEQAEKVRKVMEGLYLPKPNADGILPQCDAFFDWSMIDIHKYKGTPGAILKRYNVDQLSQTQVAKQADVIGLMTLLPDVLSREQWAKNLDYYEERCLHDSSLSYNTYSLAAARLGRAQQAYELFKHAAAVDLNDGLSSAAGIHAAAMGGIWQCAVMGFGGVEVLNGELRLRPCLPSSWKRLSFSLIFRGTRIKVTVNHKRISVVSEKPITLWLCDRPVRVEGEKNFRFVDLENENALV